MENYEKIQFIIGAYEKRGIGMDDPDEMEIEIYDEYSDFKQKQESSALTPVTTDREELINNALVYIIDYDKSEPEQQMTRKDVLYIAEIMADFYLATHPTQPKGDAKEVSITELLTLAVNPKIQHSIQYVDFDSDTWTSPSILTHERLARFMDDMSVRRIRLEFNKE